MLTKLRKAMEERNSIYGLDGIVQIDEFFLGGKSHGDGKRGRRTDQDTVMIGVSMKKGAPVHCFMELVSDMSKRTVSDVFSRRLTPDVILDTDGNPTYAACAMDIDISHLVTLSSDENAHASLTSMYRTGTPAQPASRATARRKCPVIITFDSACIRPT